MDSLYAGLSLLPIVVLLVVSLWVGVKPGIYAGLAVTTILFFVWDSSILAYPAAFMAAFVDTLSILMIVFGALLLHQSMEESGFIDQIKESLKGAHVDKGFQFYFLAFFLTAFFESVAGFGTPGAIVPLLLISLGFSPVLSIVVVLLIDGLMAITGAVGTPVIAGFEGPLDLTPQESQMIYGLSAGFMVISGFVILAFIQKFVKEESQIKNVYGWKIFLALAVPFAGLSFFLKELTGVIASAIMGAICYFFLFTNRRIDWKPWLPYGLLVLILLIPKIIEPLNSFISMELTIHEIFNSSVSASIKPLKSPLIPFVIAAVLAAQLGQNKTMKLSPVLKKAGAVFLVLMPSLAITRLMMASGTNMPSMVESLSLLFVETGKVYPLISPLIGIMGTFITGSTTVSNIIFGPVQNSAATGLDLSREVILALQLNGASLGNAICLFNIIAACAVAGVTKYAQILHKNLLPVLTAALLIGFFGYLILYFI